MLRYRGSSAGEFKLGNRSWCRIHGLAFLCASIICGPMGFEHANGVDLVDNVDETTLLDVPYGPASGQKLDVYRASHRSGHNAAVIMIHGGGWVSGDKHGYADLGHRLSERGVVVVAINYRLANGDAENFWPAQLDDVRAAARWVWSSCKPAWDQQGPNLRDGRVGWRTSRSLSCGARATRVHQASLRRGRIRPGRSRNVL